MYEGKKSEKKKTLIREKTLNPVFNASFEFDVSYERIRQTSLIITVMDYDRFGHNDEIGQVILGTERTTIQSKHWNSMIDSKPRQVLTQWHVLRKSS